MTGQLQHQLDTNVPRDSTLNKYVAAKNNKHGVRHDLESLCRFVRETLFYAMIHDARGSGTNPSDEVMGENGKACQIFVHVFLADKDKISNAELIDSTNEEKELYLKYLWREGLQTKGRYNIRRALSNEKSAVYAGISESFKSRHNRSLWKKAIRENQGLNNKRFGPAIFEAHVRTTVRENYFKWIFQQLSDIHEVEDEDIEAFQMEYDEKVYLDLPRTLVCTHKEITKFPFKNCEVDYGENFGSDDTRTTDEEKEDDNDSYCSANSRSVDGHGTTRIHNPAVPLLQQGNPEKTFFLVYKNVNANRFSEIREQQRKDLKTIIEKSRGQHEDILKCLKDIIKQIREVKKTLPDTDQRYKEAIAEAKKNLRLFKDPYEEDNEGPLRKKRRRSIENQTRFSDSKVTFFAQSNEEMKQEEQKGLRKSWEALYKEIWNKHLLIPKRPVIDIPIPQVDSMIRDMENDVNQLLADCAGMVEHV